MRIKVKNSRVYLLRTKNRLIDMREGGYDNIDINYLARVSINVDCMKHYKNNALNNLQLIDKLLEEIGIQLLKEELK